MEFMSILCLIQPGHKQLEQLTFYVQFKHVYYGINPNQMVPGNREKRAVESIKVLSHKKFNPAHVDP